MLKTTRRLAHLALLTNLGDVQPHMNQPFAHWYQAKSYPGYPPFHTNTIYTLQCGRKRRKQMGENN